MAKLSEILQLDKAIISIVGSGGKTTIMNKLANSYKDKQVLMSTTTKIFVPDNIKVLKTKEECLNHKASNGVVCMGVYNKQLNKLESLEKNDLENIIKKYDIILLESDGSKRKPLKAWKDFEPVIINQTTHTMGVISIKSLNLMVNEDNVHNIELFKLFTKDKIVSLNTLKDIIINSNGLFKNSVGKKILVINQVEEDKELVKAEELIEIVKEYNIVDEYIMGSALNDKWRQY